MFADNHARQVDRTAIAELFQAYLAAFHAEDLTQLRSYYTSDAIIMAPDVPVIVGADKIIEEWYRPMFGGFNAQMSLTSEEVRADREWGFVRGTYLFRLRPKTGGESREEHGKFLDVVRRDSDGTWKIARAIYYADTK